MAAAQCRLANSCGDVIPIVCIRPIPIGAERESAEKHASLNRRQRRKQKRIKHLN